MTERVAPTRKPPATWWMYLAPLPLCLLGSALFVASRRYFEAAPCYFPIPIGMLLVQLWGPRVAPALFLSLLLTYPVLGWGQGWQWPLFALPQTLEVLASWLLFRKVLGKGPFLDNLQAMWQYLLFGVAVPVTIFSFIKTPVFIKLGVIADGQFAWFALIRSLANFLTCTAFTAPALVMLSPWMSRRGLLEPSCNRLDGPRREPLGPWAAFEAAAACLAMLAFFYFRNSDSPLWLKSLALPGILTVYIILRHGIMAALPLAFVVAYSAIYAPDFLALYVKRDPTVLAYKFDLALYCAAIILMGRLVSDRRAGLRNERQTQRRLQAVFDAAEARIVVFGPDGEIKQMNLAAAGDFGRYNTLWDIYEDMPEIDEHGNEIQTEDRPVYKAMRTGGSFSNVVVGVRKKGSSQVRWLMANIEPVPGERPDDRPDYLVVFIDITDQQRNRRQRQELRERLRQAQKTESLGLMAGGVVHNYNNLLAVIQGNIDLARMEQGPDDKTVEYLRTAGAAAAKAAALTDRLLTFTGHHQMLIEPVRVNALLSETVRDLWSSPPAGAELIFRPAAADPIALVDASHLRAVLEALVDNAVSAAGAAGVKIEIRCGVKVIPEPLPELWRHTVTLTEPGIYCLLSIRDDGPGMDETTLGRIFDPFFSTHGDRAGLGMAMVLGVVRGHGGSVHVASAPGRGCEVTVLLPLAPQTPSERDVQDEGARFGGTVLIADDCWQSRQDFVSMLSSLGLETLSATDGLEAARLFERHAADIDLVILDMAMPVADGAQAYHMIRKARPEVPIIAATDRLGPEVKARMEGLDLADHIQKPCRPERLIQTLNRIIGHRRVSGDTGDDKQS